jgi:hypothetical protein
MRSSQSRAEPLVRGRRLRRPFRADMKLSWLGDVGVELCTATGAKNPYRPTGRAGKLKHTLPRASGFSWDFAGRRPIQTGSKNHQARGGWAAAAISHSLRSNRGSQGRKTMHAGAYLATETGAECGGERAKRPIARVAAGGLPIRRGFASLSAWPCGPPKAIKTRRVWELSTKLGKAGRGASRGPGGPPYLGRFSTVPHNRTSESTPGSRVSGVCECCTHVRRNGPGRATSQEAYRT